MMKNKKILFRLFGDTAKEVLRVYKSKDSVLDWKEDSIEGRTVIKFFERKLDTKDEN